MPRISVIIVAYDSARHLRRCLDGLLRQRQTGLEPILVDNGSRDDSVALFRGVFPAARVLRNTDNAGFARASNQGIEASSGELVLLLNADCFLEEGYLEILSRRLETRRDLAGVQGKYLDDAHPETIDSLGLEIRRTGVARDIGRGAPDPELREPFEVDGLCAAAALLRRSALESIRVDGEYFDPDFFSYYEDVDLSLRLSRRGYFFECAPGAVARHVRGGSQTDPARMHRLALRNKYFTLIKNVSAGRLVLRLPAILGWEVLKAPYFLFTCPRVLPGYLDVLRNLPLFLRKRRAHA